MSIFNTRILSYHVHVYYDDTTREKAAELRQAFLGAIEQNHELEDVLQVGNMHNVPVGPHTKPMFRIAVKQVGLTLVVNYLMLRRNGLNVLVHPETGNDLNDHTVHAMWIGDKVALDLTKL
jgi:aromatic ring-cleaving dioxygenase